MEQADLFAFSALNAVATNVFGKSLLHKVSHPFTHKSKTHPFCRDRVRLGDFNAVLGDFGAMKLQSSDSSNGDYILGSKNERRDKT
jgi:endogenous inhibitor of DNA gyrase (YacG/DUF329 family)